MNAWKVKATWDPADVQETPQSEWDRLTHKHAHINSDTRAQATEVPLFLLTFLLTLLSPAHMITGVGFFATKCWWAGGLHGSVNVCVCFWGCTGDVQPLKSILNAVVKAHRRKAEVKHTYPRAENDSMILKRCVMATVFNLWGYSLKRYETGEGIFLATVKYDLLLLYVRHRLQMWLCPLFGHRRRTWRTQTQRSHPVTTMQRHQRQFPGQRCMLSSIAALLMCWSLFMSPQCPCLWNIYLIMSAVTGSIVYV